MQSAANSFPYLNAAGGIAINTHRFPRLVAAGPVAPAPRVAPWPAPAAVRAEAARRGVLALLVATAVVGLGVGLTQTWDRPDWLALPALRDGRPKSLPAPLPRIVPPAASVSGTAAGRDKTARTATDLPAPEISALIPRGGPETVRDGVSPAFFSSHSWSPPPPPPIAVVPKPPPKPTAPPLPFAYLGKMFDAGVWEAYLARGDETFVVREHGAIDANYRVESIAPPVMTIMYLPLKQTQTLAIGDQ